MCMSKPLINKFILDRVYGYQNMIYEQSLLVAVENLTIKVTVCGLQ